MKRIIYELIKKLVFVGAFALIFASCPVPGIDMVTPVADDFDVSGLSQVYNGSPRAVNITPKAGKSGGAITVLYNGSAAAPTEVGNYTVTFNVAEFGNFNAANGLSAGTLEITLVKVTPAADDFEIGGLSQVYNGSPRAVNITPKAGKSGGAITVLYNDSAVAPTEVGDYTVTFNVAEFGNFNAANGLSAGILQINAATPVTEDFDITGLSQTYDGSPKTVNITPKAGKSGGEITILYNDSMTAPTAFGMYTVTFNVAASGNYNAVNGLSAGMVVITPPPPPTNGSFVNESQEAGYVSGTISWTIPENLESITGYRIYWGSDAVTRLNTQELIFFTAGPEESEQIIQEEIEIPEGAFYFLIYSAEEEIDYPDSLAVPLSTSIPTVLFNKNNNEPGSAEANPRAKTVISPAVTVDSLPAPPTRTGYILGGWNTQADGSGTTFTASTEVTGMITVYAQWIEEVITSFTGIEMVWIPAGTFTMGSPASEPNRFSNETQRQVTLTNGFYMGKYQVTQEQYQTVMGTNPSYFSSDPASGEVQGKRPVERVSWYDAIVFCNRLSIMEGLSPAYSINSSTNPDSWGTVPTSSNSTWNAVTIVSGSNGYRLPTEAQWEYACRAGTTTAYNTGASISDYTGWYTSNSNLRTHEVGKKRANAWGLYDMHGNVWEWCYDWYETYASGSQTDPAGASSGTSRVIRGGNGSDSAGFLRSAHRNTSYPYNRGNYFGFRLVRPCLQAQASVR